MSNAAEFIPQWASPPGDTIADALAERNWSVTEFVDRLGESVDTVQGLLTGAIPITIGIARRLQATIGGSVAFWMGRDRQFRQDAERVRDRASEWRASLPLNDMAKFGWVETTDSVTDLLRYFDVPDVSAWNTRFGGLLHAANFRTSPSFQPHSAAVATWLRQGERIAATVACGRWNPNALRLALSSSIRNLSRIHRPERFLGKLRQILRSCGVALAVVPAPTGCRASGATFWLSSEKALLLLSARHLTDDHFWFTLYHECGHLLLHRENQLFLEEDAEISTALEEGANEFAIAALIGDEVRERLRTAKLDTDSVLRLSRAAGIAPGILVGQLQKMGRLGPQRLNRLKNRYEWSGDQLISRERT